MTEQELLRAAAETIKSADALLIGAGAGMGVDSGMPDFRGDRGFWNAYPPYEKLGLNFISLANPRWFRDDPTLAWGFYGHRRNLYRATTPHAGFAILRRWASRMKHGCFVYTSNVDGHFQKSGFDPERVLEVHGTVEFNQCLSGACPAGVLPVPADENVMIDETTMRAQEPLPRCPECGGLLRPNILMFGDWGWNESRTWEQEQRFNRWLGELKGSRLAVVECGAGTAIPTVRQLCEHVADMLGGVLIRLNVREPSVPVGHVGLGLGALAGLTAIDGLLGN